MNRFVVTLIIASGLMLPAQAQLANQPPAPQWITAPEKAAAVFTRVFQVEGPLLKAILFIASDVEARITVNGQSAGSAATSPQTAASHDITRHLQAGDNEVRIGLKQPGRVAALLELNGDLARKSWIATDGNWRVNGAGASVAGATDADPAANPFDFKKTFDAYNSWQLAKPGAQKQATDATGLLLLPGFKAQRVRSAVEGEDSWVAMAFDPQGRVTLGKEKKGLLRFDPKSGEMKVVEDTLLECRGLLYAHGALYAHANNSRGLHRLRDLDGNGVFEDKQEIMHTEGGVGHGRNHIKLGPDGRIWVAQGNNVLLPSPIAAESPLKNYAADQALPNPWDGSMFDGNVELPAGHVLSVNPDGSDIRLVAGGLRNPLDIAFNRAGELFTFDADMERDVGAPWYMPTRVLHVVSGADFGWRRGTGRWLAWFVDTLPAVVDIGLSSPTGICFGYGLKFPHKYAEALFILDWSYGRIIAVHLKAQGASYTGTQETFVSGRPLNVTDACVGPDGALWFITGGRGTQSGLYRLVWEGGTGQETPASADKGAEDLRALRHRLEAWHGGVDADKRAEALAMILPALDHQDRFIRHAARVALEQIPAPLWRQEIIDESRGWRGILGCLALARTGRAEDCPGILARLRSLSWKDLGEEQRLAVLRVLDVTLARFGDPARDEIDSLMAWLEPHYPATSREMNQELCRLLIRLESKQVLPKSLTLLKDATASEDLVFYPVHLRYLKDGWSLDSRRMVFEALNRAEKRNGASTYFKAIQDTRSELAARLSAADALALASVIHPPKPAALSPHALPGHTFRVWKLEDLLPRLDQVSKGRSHAQARAALISAQCVFCHRVSNDPALPAGIFGPDLVQVSARFNRRDLLDHILNPSKIIDEKFRLLTLTRTDGTTITGTLESEDDERVVLKPNPLAPETVETGKAMIRERKLSDMSPMPPGLLNALKAEQILDMLAWFEAGGDPRHPVFQQ